MIPQLSQLQQSLHRACCCGNVCANCPDTLPSTVEFALAGLDITACCERVGFGQSYLAVGAPDINGTYVLASNHSIPTLCGNADTCGYGYTEASVFSLSNYSSTTCGGAPNSTITMTIIVKGRFYDDGGGIRFWVEVFVRGDGGGTPLAIFRGQSDVLTNCMDVNGAVIANECPACGVDDNVFSLFKCWDGVGGQTFGDGAGTITVTI